MVVWNSIRTGNLNIEGIISGFTADDVEPGHEHAGAPQPAAKKGKAS